MIEFTWTVTVAESHLWARELRPFADLAPTLGDLAARRDGLPARTLPAGVFPAGTTDLDLLDHLLRARPAGTTLADVLAEPRREMEVYAARLELTQAGHILDWEGDLPIVALPAHIVRAGRIIATVGFTADCFDPRQHEWDQLREGWLPRLADAGWQPCSTAFLAAAMTGFLDVYQRQSAPEMHTVVPVEPLSAHPVIRGALDGLRPVHR